MKISLNNLKNLIALISFCAVVTLPVSLSVLMIGAQTIGNGGPLDEGEDTSEEELVTGQSERRRVPKVHKTHSCESVEEFHKTSYRGQQLSSTFDHQLANGLRAPLVI